jgi:succinoglycan biosynthesis transport protein ExoP
MNIVQIWRMLWARRALILVSMLVCLVLATIAARAIPQYYEASARVMLDTLRPDPVTNTAMSPQATKAFVQAQTDFIRDYRVAGAVVDAFGWERSPELRAAYAARPQSDTRDFRRWAAQTIIDNTSVKPPELNSNILVITYRSTSADTSRRVAEAIRTAYIDQAVEFRRDNARRNAVWFRTQAEKIKQQLAAAEARKSEFERANNIIMQDDQTDTETAKLRALANTPQMAPPVSFSAPAMPSPSAAQLAQVDAQIASTLQTLGPNHPDVVALRQQRAAVASAAAREQAAARSTGGGASGPTIASQISAQAQKVLAQRGLVGEAQRLAGDVAVFRDQLAKTTERAADFELQAQATEVGIEPLGNAVGGSQPISPMWLLLMAGGVAIGLALGAALALAIELMFRRVRGTEDLAIDGLPVLGEMKRKPSSGLAATLGFGRRRGGNVTA